ncbi:MAG: hypothetical protein WC879_05765 [Melioribacteraceae bacterium]
MNKNIVQVITSLFEDSKYFLLEAQKHAVQDPITDRYIKASLLLAWAAFEGWINKTSLDFAKSFKDLSVNEKAFLQEKRVNMDKGQFRISNGDKYESIENKLEFLLVTIAKSNLDKSTKHWQDLLNAKELRGSLVHPKESRLIEYKIHMADDTIKVLSYYLNVLSKKIYDKNFRI